METLILIYLAINIFISGMIFSQSIEDEDSILSALGISLFYLIFGVPIAIIVGSIILIGNYIYTKKNKTNK